MKFRRMRKASLDEIVAPLDAYKTNLENDLKGILKYVDGFEDRLQSSIQRMQDTSIDPGERRSISNGVKRDIIGLINGSGKFPGLSELPETDDYAKLYDKIVEEYNSLQKSDNKATRDKGTAVDSSELIKGFENEAREFSKSIDDFINSLKVYGESYPREWKPFGDEIKNLANKYNDIAMNGSGTDEDFNKLNKIYSDFNYYLKQFGRVFSETPTGTVGKCYSDALDKFRKLAETMRKIYDMSL